MQKNNNLHSINLIFTNHVRDRIQERKIPMNGLEMVRRYGTESEDRGGRKAIIDLEACESASDEGVDIMKYYSLTIVVTGDGILKTAYYGGI